MLNSSVHVKDSLIQECITSQCRTWPVAIYSNMTHFNVGHFDEVSAAPMETLVMILN